MISFRVDFNNESDTCCLKKQNKQDRVLSFILLGFVFETTEWVSNNIRFVFLFVRLLVFFFVQSSRGSQFVVFTDADPDYRNPGSLLVRPLNSLVYFGGFPVLF